MNAPQGSEAWALARCGRATASEFASILAQGKERRMRTAYLRRLVAERLTGKPVETYRGKHMERGQEQEPYAREAYEIETGNIVDLSEFIPHSKIMAGCSPDGLVGDDGGIEAKSVIATVQLETIERIYRGEYPPEHRAQIQGNLWITRRKWWDFCSYCADMPEHLRLRWLRVYPDPKYIETLASEVVHFLDEVDVMYARLMARSPLHQKYGDGNHVSTQA